MFNCVDDIFYLVLFDFAGGFTAIATSNALAIRIHIASFSFSSALTLSCVFFIAFSLPAFPILVVVCQVSAMVLLQLLQLRLSDCALWFWLAICLFDNASGVGCGIVSSISSFSALDFAILFLVCSLVLASCNILFGSSLPAPIKSSIGKSASIVGLLMGFE